MDNVCSQTCEWLATDKLTTESVGRLSPHKTASSRKPNKPHTKYPPVTASGDPTVKTSPHAGKGVLCPIKPH